MRAPLSISSFLCVLCLLCASASSDTLDDRATILRAEMVRDAAALHPYLQPDAAPALRRLAIRALGRIGNDGNGPGMLRDMLSSATPESEKALGLLLWSAGIAHAKELAEPLTAQLHALLGAKQWDLAGTAAGALGWTGADDVAKTLRPLLANEHSAVRVGALEGMARGGAKSREDLLAASALVGDKAAGVRAAADYACWLIAGRFAREAKKADKDWDGDSAIAARFLEHLDDADPDRRMAGLRVLGSLLSEAVKNSTLPGLVASKLEDKDPRVVQDVVSRILARRKGQAYDNELAKALGHADPKVRQQAAEALGDREGEAVRLALTKAWHAEKDARVREVLTVQLVKHQHEDYWTKLAARDDRPKDAAVRQTTEALVLLNSKRKEALDELFVWADPGASQRAGNIHAVVWMTILGGLEGKEHPKLDEWLTGFLAGGYAVDKPDRHFVLGSAISLVGANKRFAHADALLEMLGRTYSGPPHDEIKQSVLHEEIRSALMGAFADLAGDEACPPETKKAMIQALGKHLGHDPSPWVRRAAWAAFKKLKEEPPEEGPYGGEHDQSNAWKGVPRAAKPTAGIPTSAGEGDWLDEKAILKLADWLATAKPRIVFVTTAGTIALELDPVNAPVHSVSLLNAVRNGVYADTRFHRVVPNFVIQGGDPHGHGAGGGGWTVPDEISTKRYVRGALGMPKSTKDDGGCQIFIMHTTYRPLDERYTCYGTVTSGMDAVDKIRVGDRILSAHVAYGE